MEFFLFVLGALCSFAIVVWTEFLKKPRLTIDVVPPRDHSYGGNAIAKDARWLEVLVSNEPPAKSLFWVLRQPAVRCQATVSFHHVDGHKVFVDRMPARWSDTPEPFDNFFVNGQQVHIPDIHRMFLPSEVDIPAGVSEKFGIAGRFDNDDACYGWTAQSYVSKPPWRNSKWKLDKGDYLVHVVVRSSGQKAEATFRLANSAQRCDFRLDETATTIQTL